MIKSIITGKYLMPCEHCKIEVASENHHISYFPEVIIRLCYRCHKVIHKLKLPMYDKYKQYKKGDSKFFYGKKFRDKKSNRKKRCWLDITPERYG